MEVSILGCVLDENWIINKLYIEKQLIVEVYKPTLKYSSCNAASNKSHSVENKSTKAFKFRFHTCNKTRMMVDSLRV